MKIIIKILSLPHSYLIILLISLFIKYISSNKNYKLELILSDIKNLDYNSNDNKIVKSNLYQKLGQFYQYDCSNIINNIGNKQNEEQLKIDNFDDCLLQQSNNLTSKSRNICSYCSLQSYLLAKEYFINGNKKELIKQSLFSLLDYDYVGMLNDIGVLHGRYGNVEESNIIYEEALYHNPNSPSILTNLASNMVNINSTYTQELYDKAISLYENDIYYSEQIKDASIVLYNYGVYLFKINDYKKAKLIWQKSYTLNNDMYLSLGNLATLTCMKGSFNHVIEAKEQFQVAINKAFELNDYENFYWLILQLKLAVPIISSSKEEILITRKSFISNALTLINDEFLFNTIADPIANSLGCSSLGYYMEYHGFEDLYVRQLHGLVYW
jgi:tetratricopeptide (TPR) repeat protein